MDLAGVSLSGRVSMTLAQTSNEVVKLPGNNYKCAVCDMSNYIWSPLSPGTRWENQVFGGELFFPAHRAGGRFFCRKDQAAAFDQQSAHVRSGQRSAEEITLNLVTT
jgi:hypothetical protein